LREIRIGKYAVPLWLIVVLLVSGIGASAYYTWQTLTIQLEVKEPLEILSYPSELSLYPGETKEFNVTIENRASVNYSVVLDFSLDNITYQDNYITFSNEIYTVIPGQQNLTAWLKVESHAPPLNASLTIDFMRTTKEGEALFFDDFNDGTADGWTEHLGTWNVINDEYFVTVGLVENGISTVNGLTLTDCIIEVTLRFSDTEVGYRAGIIFRYVDNEHYYSFEIGNEYDEIDIIKYSSKNPEYGESRTFIQPSYGNSSIIIDANVDYTLRIEVHGNMFTAYLNDQEVLSWTEETYSSGKVGLRARRADAFFDNFKVTEIP